MSNSFPQLVLTELEPFMDPVCPAWMGRTTDGQYVCLRLGGSLFGGIGSTPEEALRDASHDSSGKEPRWSAPIPPNMAHVWELCRVDDILTITGLKLAAKNAT